MLHILELREPGAALLSMCIKFCPYSTVKIYYQKTVLLEKDLICMTSKMALASIILTICYSIIFAGIAVLMDLLKSLFKLLDINQQKLICQSFEPASSNKFMSQGNMTAILSVLSFVSFF